MSDIFFKNVNINDLKTIINFFLDNIFNNLNTQDKYTPANIKNLLIEEMNILINYKKEYDLKKRKTDTEDSEDDEDIYFKRKRIKRNNY